MQSQVVIGFTLLPLAINLIIATAPLETSLPQCSVFLRGVEKYLEGPTKREEWSFTLQLQSKVVEPMRRERNF